jgi:hypothetical protein
MRARGPLARGGSMPDSSRLEYVDPIVFRLASLRQAEASSDVDGER